MSAAGVPGGARMRLLSPPGAAAVAVLEVRGPGASDALGRVFRGRGEKRALPAAGASAVGVIEAPDGSPADEVVLLRPTADERFEVDGHGGPGVLARLERALASAGVLLELPAAPPLTARASTWLGLRVASWVEEGLLAPDDPLVAPLLEPRKVALAGRPNAGKSSLFNALLDRPRALVSPEAGTTRDVVEEETAVHGVPLVLCDTAGVSSPSGGDRPFDFARPPAAPRSGRPEEAEEPATLGAIARAAERRALAARAAADLVLLCVDGSQPLAPGEEPRDPRTLLVLTKADLPHAFAAPEGALRVSARTGAGMEALSLALAARLLGRDPRAVTRPSIGGRP